MQHEMQHERNAVEQATKIRPVVYNAVYADEKEKTHKFYPDGIVTFIPDGQLGNRVFSTTPEEYALRGSPNANVAVVENSIAVTTAQISTVPVRIATRLGYDISSYYNISVESAIFKIPVVIAQITSALAKLPPAVTKVFSKLAPLGIAVGVAVSSFVLLKSSVKGLMTDTGSLTGNLLKLGAGVGIATAAVAGLALTGHPALAVIVGITAALGAAIGAIEAVNEDIAAQNKLITDSMLYKNGGTKISDIANAYSDWADNARKLNQQTIDKYNQLGQYDDEMAELVATMEKVTKIDLNLDEITPADAEALRQPFNDLITYLDSDFKERTQTVADDIRDIFAKLGLDEVVSSQVGQAYTEMQERFERNLTESQTIVDEYLKKIQSGGVLSKAEKLKFSNEYAYVLESAKSRDKSYVALDRTIEAFNALDLSKIDFESNTTALEAMQSVLDSSQAYQESLKLRYDAEIDNLAALRQQTKTDYTYGHLTAEQYKQQHVCLICQRRLLG